MTFGQHKELIALSGWVTALLACVDWDMNEREAAETARAATLRFAKEVGHSELIAWSYEIQAWFALTEGRYSDVTSIAKAAQNIGGENSAIVQLIMQEARGWARLGKRQAAESAIERAYSLLQKLPAINYPRHFIFDSTKFPFYVAPGRADQPVARGRPDGARSDILSKVETVARRSGRQAYLTVR